VAKIKGKRMGIPREWFVEDKKFAIFVPSRWEITRKDVTPHMEAFQQTAKIQNENGKGWSTMIYTRYKEM